jgi:uncharacterized protein YfaS (alpha-2-macroglobulin family)
MKRWLPLILLLLSLAVTAAAALTPVKQATKANLEISSYRRCYNTGEALTMRLNAYNVKAVTFSVYPVDLSGIVKTSETLKDFGKTIKAYPLSGKRAIRTWKYKVDNVYPDQWNESEVKSPKLPAGAYIVRAAGNGVEARTWIAVTDIALVAKRSLDEVLVYAAEAGSGRPVPGLGLTLMDKGGRRTTGTTGAGGVLRTSTRGLTGNLWVYGANHGHPAFILSGQPPAPEPFTVYQMTDRPIYRPGQQVLFKGTVRQRLAAAKPGEYNKKPYADKPVTVEIRDATDALVYRHDVRTNANGSFDGSLDLASEPVMGRWQLITVIGDYREYASFTVQAYRKPEFTATVTFAKAHVIGGEKVPITLEARYLFGQPVVGAAVSYTVSFERTDYDPETQGQSPERTFEGHGVTDEHGFLRGEFPTKRLPFSRMMTVEATVTDSSRRTQSASGGLLVTAGAFHLEIDTDKDVYKPGDKIQATVHALDYDDKPVAASVRVQMIETKYDQQHRAYNETTTRNVTTNAKGDATAVFDARRPGELTLEARAFDPDDRTIKARERVSVADPEWSDQVSYPTLDLKADRSSYKPGDTAVVVLHSSLATPRTRGKAAKKPDPDSPRTYEQAWALVTIDGERLYEHRIVPITGPTTLLKIPVTAAYFPSAQVSAVIVQNNQIYEDQARLTVRREEQKLHITVDADKKEYAPGETATLTVTARDYKNRPVAAEVALGVVDSAIYEIEPDHTPDIERFFYPDQQVRVETAFSFAAQYSGGAFQTIPRAPSHSATSGGGIRVRSKFVDTAYWNAFVMTDASGAATVPFTAPDNLTSWRATARAVTPDTKVGGATHTVVTTMPLLVRLALPRFYVAGDTGMVTALVHNNTAEARTVAVAMEAEGVALDGAERRTLQLPAHGEARIDWPAKLTTPGEARIRITADGGAGAQDAVEDSVPVLVDGQKEVTARADALGPGAPFMNIDVGDLLRGSTLTLRLAPSLAAASLDALRYLKEYPYGCAEQSASALSSDVVVTGTLHRLGVTRPVSADLNRTIGIGLQKLYRYQHQDGGWNWWEMDQSSPDMTAYVLGALMAARGEGQLVDDQRILRAAGYLKAALAEDRDPGHRADWVLPLAAASPKDAAPILNDLVTKRAKLDTYGLASLCLALVAAGRNEAAITAGVDLERSAITQGTTVHWEPPTDGYDWRDDDVAVTAHVVRALLATRPDSRAIRPAILWLMANREGKAWSSTRSTAEAVTALAAFMAKTEELKPDFRARVLLDDDPIKELHYTAANAADEPTVMTLTADQLRGHKTLRVERDGSGWLYAAATITSIVPEADTGPVRNGITVRRSYRITVEDPSVASSIGSGQDVEVVAEVSADTNYRYVILEEPIPAGCEVVGNGDSDGGDAATRREVRDDKVVFFFDTLAAGSTRVTYHLHTETPGDYHILPSRASLVYFPEVGGTDKFVRMKIGEREDAK